jgi:hypothetical protein
VLTWCRQEQATSNVAQQAIVEDYPEDQEDEEYKELQIQEGENEQGFFKVIQQ